MEKLLDAGPELLLFHPTCGSRVQDPGLHDELEKVLQGLEVWGQKGWEGVKDSRELTQQGMKGKGTANSTLKSGDGQSQLGDKHVFFFFFFYFSRSQPVRYPHGFLDVVLPNEFCRAVHVPLQTADELPGGESSPRNPFNPHATQPDMFSAPSQPLRK